MTEKLKILCLAKVIPDVEHFVYDYERNILVRENTRQVLNPDDAAAIAAALKLKKSHGAQVTVITMGPASVRRHLEDLVRRGVDKGILVTDPLYIGSDSYATAGILAKCIQRYPYDMIFCGTRSLDGDTSHIPSQIAELLNCNVMCNILKIHEECITEEEVQVDVMEEDRMMRFAVAHPAVLGVSSESKYKLPFARYENMKKDVSHCIECISNQELGLPKTQVGIGGSKTKVTRTYPRQGGNGQKTVVQADEEGAKYVYQFLKDKGFL